MGSSTKKHKKDRDSSSSKKLKHKDKVRAPSPPIIRDELSAANASGGREREQQQDRGRDREQSDRDRGRDREPQERGRDREQPERGRDREQQERGRDREQQDRGRDREQQDRGRDRDREQLERERERERRHKKNREAAASSSKDGKKESSSHRRDRSPHRDHRRREADYHSDSSDVVEVVAPPAPQISGLVAAEPRRSASPIPEAGAGDCLSVAETNKLRAKLGLKPLEENPAPAVALSAEEAAAKNPLGLSMHTDEWGEFLHKPADNIASKLEAEKLREKFRQKKEKRLLEEKLKKVKLLGEAEEADDINAWLDRSRDKEKNREEAAKRAKMLEEMDDQFGVTALVQQELRDTRRKAYTDRHLTGLKVDHEMDAFGEGKTVILTLKDQEILNEEDGDTLINVNMVDDERYKKNTDNRKLNPNSYGYDVYAEQFDHFGNPIERNILGKYDEEIEGGAAVKKSFTIGENLEDERDRQRRLLEVKTKLAGRRLESLDEPTQRLASDTYTEDEMAKFKKPKKKIKKLRQKLKAEDLMPLPGDNIDSSAHMGRRRRQNSDDGIMDSDDIKHNANDYADIKVEEEDDDLEQILAKARRLKQKEALITKTLSTEIKAEFIKSEADPLSDSEQAARDPHMVLNATAEFCRTLGDIPTYGMSGNRDEDAADMMDDDEDPAMDVEETPHDTSTEERSTGTWNSINPDVVEIDDSDKIHEKIRSEVAILDEEPDVGSGVGAALKLAVSKGYLEKEDLNRPSNTRMAHLQAKNYSIDDKAHGDDDKFQRRDRFQHGPISDFKEKDSYRPNVKLEYIDDSGRLLNEKEAFRYLSHKFHGKGPGKNKIEKRLKKNEQDGLLMKMSSTDTPLGTLTMLKHKQLETHSPYIVLSGSKQMQPSTSIVKHK